MAPTLTGGDFVIASRLYFALAVGDLVVVKHPIYQYIVKRIMTIDNKRLQLIGENETSVSTENMGWIEQKQVKGKVFYAVHKNSS